MDQSQIEWLKTSIPGIILLGAIGSIIAVVILKTLAVGAARLFPPAKSSLQRSVYGFWRGPPLIVEHLRTSQEPRELIVTLALLLTLQIMLCAGIATGTLLVAMSAIVREGNIALAQFIGVSGSMLAFLSMFFFLMTARQMFAIYMIHMCAAEVRVQELIVNMIQPRDGEA